MFRHAPSLRLYRSPGMEYDRTPLPEVYRLARTLPPEAIEVWKGAIRAMLPEPTAVERVVDLGCGTARFTGLLADLLHAPVIGIDPSLRMLAEREVHDGRFVAGTAEALPLAAGSIELVFASMVYHHLRADAALGEIRRVLRPDGRLMIRTPTLESVDNFVYLAFFPQALAIDRARMPSRAALIETCDVAGFTLRGHEIVRHRFADDHADYFRKISLRGLSSLRLISDEAFARGLREFAGYCRSAERGEPIYELVELFLFARR
jgi:SAM-dependent methyltransferase